MVQAMLWKQFEQKMLNMVNGGNREKLVLAIENKTKCNKWNK